MKWIIIAALLLAGAGAIYVRTVSHDPARWHVDPATITQDDMIPRKQYIGFGAFDMTDSELSHRVDAFAASQPNVTRLAGTMEEGWATYVATTPVVGFPDYVSVRVSDMMGSALITIYSRSRFGYSDLGANKARVKNWLSQLRKAPGQ